LLLERGADVQDRNSQGETPLIIAVCTGRRSMVDILLGHAAKLKAGNNEDATPLYIAGF